MLVPKASDSGACPRWISSLKIKSLIGLQPVPPHSTGQCGTDQPFAARIRVQATMSSLTACSPEASCLSRIATGKLSRTKLRTSSRNETSSALKLRSIARSSRIGVAADPGLFDQSRDPVNWKAPPPPRLSRAERDGSEVRRMSERFVSASSPEILDRGRLTDQSHLAPLDRPHPSLLRNNTGGRERGYSAARLAIAGAARRSS